MISDYFHPNFFKLKLVEIFLKRDETRRPCKLDRFRANSHFFRDFLSRDIKIGNSLGTVFKSKFFERFSTTIRDRALRFLTYLSLCFSKGNYILLFADFAQIISLIPRKKLLVLSSKRALLEFRQLNFIRKKQYLIIITNRCIYREIFD